MIGPIGAISEPSQTPWCRSHSLPSGGILLFCAPAAAHANFLSLLGRGAWDCEASIDAVGWTSRDGRHRKFCGGNWLCGWVVGLAQSNEGTRHWKSAERRRAMCYARGRGASEEDHASGRSQPPYRHQAAAIRHQAPTRAFEAGVQK